MPKRFVVGLEIHRECKDLHCAMKDLTTRLGFGFLCTKLFDKEFVMKSLFGEGDFENVYATPDMALVSPDWNCVVGILDIDICHEKLESPDFTLAEKVVSLQLNYFKHIALPATIIDLYEPFDNLARILYEKACSDAYSYYWIKVSMGSGQNQGNLDDPLRGISWNEWNKFRSLCNFDKKIYPILDVPEDLPDPDVIDRWLGEPVKALFISPNSFITNSKGFPVLPKRFQNVIKAFFEINSQVVIKYSPDIQLDNYKLYRQYIEYIHSIQAEKNAQDEGYKFVYEYRDYLQCPLQPLMDNLESQTYEVFEQDPVKYELYHDALRSAIAFKRKRKADTVVVMVVGAGRGPIVRACLQAAEECKAKVKVYVVEKNINAFNTLLHLKRTVWGDKVTLVACDMRKWNAPEKADVMVSELLGSFGDNELSPECLDGAQCCLKDDGVMIPKSYTSFVAPIMSSKLYNEVEFARDWDKPHYSRYEIPYVVNIHNRYDIDEAKEVFTFSHPKIEQSSNARTATLKFSAKLDCVLHGFAGYFESILYDDVKMSIVPQTRSPGMFSWFPMYFPLKDPVFLKQHDELSVRFWRCCNERNVWYEWAVLKPYPSPIHNPNGRSYTIGL